MRGLSWWKCGVWGATVLVLVTAVGVPLKVVAYWVRYHAVDVPWRDVPFFLGAIPAMGFVGGVVVWLLLPLSRKLGAVGDALIGLVTMVVFFALCMFLFAPSLLMPNPARGLAMWVLAIIVGSVLGAWCGRDIRSFIRERGRAEPRRNIPTLLNGLDDRKDSKP